jgi:drug/metabolite transporter (DMT)-like permease
VSASKSNGAIAASLVLAVILWGGSNAGVKFLVGGWPPVWIGSLRFVLAGGVLLGLLRWTTWLGPTTRLSAEVRRRLWWRGGLTLAAYIVVFNTALTLTSASHVALYLGAAPVWALLGEGWPPSRRQAIQRYGAAGLALIGVSVLAGPAAWTASGSIGGELLGLSASVLWTGYGRQCRAIGAALTSAELTGHTLWRAGLWLLPWALAEAGVRGVVWRADYVGVFAYTVLAGAVVPFALWSHGLRHWPTRQVYLFNNLIPLSTTVWAHFCLGEPVTPRFWLAMLLVVTAVVLGQTDWQKVLGARWLPED